MKSNVPVIIGICFIIGMAVLGGYVATVRQSEKQLRVVGYASKEFDSDLVKWTLGLQRTCEPGGLKAAYTNMGADVSAFKKLLLDNGLTEKEISIQPVTSMPVYSNYDSGNLLSYKLNQSVYVISGKMDALEQLSLNPGFFADRGVLVQTSNLSYLYTKLPDLKKQLLGEATADALNRAKEIAQAAKVRLGKLKDARAGVFQITEPYSTEVSDYGIYNTNTRRKSITVTVTTAFRLK